MTINKLYFLGTVALLLLCSCSQDLPVNDPQESSPILSSSNPYRVSLLDALNTAEILLSELDGGSTRKARSIESIDFFVKERLSRSNSDADTLLYIVNFKDKEGFAILGADKRVDPIYGFSNSGNLDLADTTENKALALCLDNIRNCASSLTGGIVRDSTVRIPDDGKYIPDPSWNDRNITILQDHKPMLATNVSDWAQVTHFNDNCPMISNGISDQHAVVGCIPLACAQIMSFFSWPETYGGSSIDWENFKLTPIFQYPNYFDNRTEYRCPIGLSQFLANIGQTLKVKYGLDNTSASYLNIITNFHKFGYARLSSPKSFNAAKSYLDLATGPLLVLADSKSDEVGHAWVIDGYFSYKETWSAIDNDTHTLYYSYYHCVWGWGGKNNGYFTCSDSSSMGTTPTTNPEVPVDNNKPLEPHKVFSNLRYFSNFNPINNSNP